jgi:bacterioferritin-associated ferredoxin
MFLCLCKTVGDSHVRALGQSGLSTPEELIDALGLDHPECCGRCRRNIHRFVAIAKAHHISSADTLNVLSVA